MAALGSLPCLFCIADHNIDSGNLKWFEAEEVQLTDQVKELSGKCWKAVNSVTYGHLQLSYISTENAVANLVKLPGREPIAEAEILHSDLLPAKYEGGLKIWECTHDLANFLTSHSELNLSGKKVLDLGCGAGILGLVALLEGASEVHFQDYNDSVLRSVTMQNVLLNTSKAGVTDSRCRYFAGDWQSYVQLVDKELCSDEAKFDYILSSETIYNPSNHSKLYSVLKTTLKSTGTVFVAAKSYYFGVGGGLRQFETFLETDSILESSVCWKCSEGLQREILKITFKTK